MGLAIDLSGQTALVTGCKRGIGLAICKTLAEAGADIIGSSASLEARGSEAEKAVLSAGRSFMAYQCDFSDRQATIAFADKMEKRGDISILVNNAGTIRRAHRRRNTPLKTGIMCRRSIPMLPSS
jgi:2-deoxy-D-gluconate 3-dehydrogenase